MSKKKFSNLYSTLHKEYGSQGWWPLSSIKTNNGYHPNNYKYPVTAEQRFEICVGAILTQNTSWKNVEKAIANLKEINALSMLYFLDTPEKKIKKAIRPAGYFNQKYKKLVAFTKFFLSIKKRTPTREELLEIWGIGPETADSILLYAYKEPIFVVDAYTKKLLLKNKIIPQAEKASYEDIQKLFMDNLERDYKLYQEYHALIVANGKIKKM
jgi:endonuclease-3 related protein